MPDIGTGISSQLVYAPEATGDFGVAPDLASNEPLEFKSETFALQKTTVQGQGLHAGGLFDRAARRVLTNYAVTGGITIDLPTRFIGNLIQHMVGSFGQTLATPTEISTTGVYKSVHLPGTLFGNSLCFQKGVPDVDTGAVEPFTYVGCKISDWEISVATGALAQLTLTVDGRNELAGSGNGDPLNASVPDLATFDSLPGSGADLSSFHFREATLYTGGTPSISGGLVSVSGGSAAGNISTVAVKETKALDTGRYFIGSSGFKAEQLENGFRQVTGSFTIEWLNSEAMYDAFAADTTQTLRLTFVGPIIGTSGSNTALFEILLPNVKLDGESPQVSGPQVVTQNVSFTALDDEATAPYQIIFQSEDSAL